MMDSTPLKQLMYNPKDIDMLKKGKFETVVDLLLSNQPELAKRCGATTTKAKEIYKALETIYPMEFQTLEQVKTQGDEMFTTGDDELDSALGGGIRTGVVWEIAGESAAGKTQLALQLSMLVQLPLELRGLKGSACYLATKSQLQTGRLMSISESHPRIVEGVCHGDNVLSTETPNIPRLLKVLSDLLPRHIEDTRAPGSSLNPVKLLVIDALGELFHLADKTSTTSLVERSRNIAEIAGHLHRLANKYQIAVVVLNEVTDAFDRGRGQGGDTTLYRIQAPLFGTASSITGENKKEVALAIVWANQVNVRILLSRTNRRRYMDESSNKMQKIDIGKPNTSAQPGGSDEPVLIRRMTVIFSSVCLPTSRDYIVTTQGIVVLPPDTITSPVVDTIVPLHPLPIPEDSLGWPAQAGDSMGMDPDVSVDSMEGISVSVEQTELEQGPGLDEEEDEWQDYWRQQDVSEELQADGLQDIVTSASPPTSDLLSSPPHPPP